MKKVKGNVEVTIKINSTIEKKLKDVMKEVWEMREEHPDIKIYVEVSRSEGVTIPSQLL